MHTLCVLRRREVERFANKVSIQMIPLKVESRHWHCQLRAIYNKQLHVNKTHFIVSIFLHTYMCVLLVLRLFLVEYCFFNRWEETFKLFVNLLISPCQILPTAKNRWDHCKQSTYMLVLLFWMRLGWNNWRNNIWL